MILLGDEMGLIFAIVAIVLFWKLWREFGKMDIKIETISDEPDMKDADLNNLANTDSENIRSEIQDSESKLASIFKDWSLSSFIEYAESYFDCVFDAFVNSHLDALKMRLTPKLYEEFCNNIQKRESRNLRQELKIEHILTRIEDISIGDIKSSLLVSFNVLQMSAMIDKDGISMDNPKRIAIDVLHKWTFERKNDNNHTENWIVSSTQSSAI